MNRFFLLLWLTAAVAFMSPASAQPLAPSVPAEAPEGEFSLESLPSPEVDLRPAQEAPPRPVDPEAQRKIDALREVYEAEEAPAAAEAPAAEENPGSSELFDVLRVIASLCMVLAVIALLVWVLRRLGKRNPLLAGQHYGRILGRLYLSPQASLHFVKVGERVLAIGVTAQHMALVAEFHPDELDIEKAEPEPERPQEKVSSFLEELKASTGDWRGESFQQDELTELRGDLQRLQAYLRERVREPGE